MNFIRKCLFVGSAAAAALILSAGDTGAAQAGGDASSLQARLDDLTLGATNAVAQWQPASDYVPTAYPTDGSWERMLASAGH